MTNQYCLSRPHINGRWTWNWYDIWDITIDEINNYEYWEMEFIKMQLSVYDYFSRNQACIVTYGVNYELKYLESQVISKSEINADLKSLLNITNNGIDKISRDEMKFLFKSAIRGYCHISLVDLSFNSRLVPTDEGMNYYLYLENELDLEEIHIPQTIQVEFLGTESFYVGEGFDS